MEKWTLPSALSEKRTKTICGITRSLRMYEGMSTVRVPDGNTPGLYSFGQVKLSPCQSNKIDGSFERPLEVDAVGGAHRPILAKDERILSHFDSAR